MKKILLVEDTLLLAEEIADILALEGFEVIISQNGISALEILATYLPDLIITDLLMPGMDGFELIRNVRARISKSVPIIILSAKVSDADKAHGAELGANAFLQKPCKVHELVAAIKERLP